MIFLESQKVEKKAFVVDDVKNEDIVINIQNN